MVGCYEDKGDALDKNNYRRIKLQDQVMKIVERVITQLISNRIRFDKMWFGFVPQKSTTEAIVIVRQLQKKYLAKNKPVYLAFVGLEKAVH